MVRDPVVIADAGPLIRLAAAGLLTSLRSLNRTIVLVDRVEDEVCGDPTKPYAAEISAWVAAMGDAVVRARTLIGDGVAALRATAGDDPAETARLKRALRSSGERAIREYVEDLDPADADDVLIVYEDRDVPALMAATRVPSTLTTTRGFVRKLVEWRINADAVAALEGIADRFDLKPPATTRIDARPDRDG